MAENPWSPRYFIEPTVTWRFVTSWTVYSRLGESGIVQKVAGPFPSKRQAEQICRIVYDAWQIGYNSGLHFQVASNSRPL